MYAITRMLEHACSWYSNLANGIATALFNDCRVQENLYTMIIQITYASDLVPACLVINLCDLHS